MNRNINNGRGGNFGMELQNGMYRNIGGMNDVQNGGNFRNNGANGNQTQNGRTGFLAQDRMAEQNVLLARRLMRLFTQEFTNISNILYRSIMVDPLYPGVSDILDTIAADDVISLRELGRLILDLGENPRIVANIRTPQINYTPLTGLSPDFLKRMINDTLEVEAELLKNYNEIIASTDDRAVKDVLTRIIGAHEDHVPRLNQILVS